MKGSDKFLLLLLAVIVLIVVAALVAVLRAPAPAYQAEDTPQGVAHNYLLALRQGDYERAYAYLSPDLPGLPSMAGFVDDVARNPWQFERGDNTAVVVDDAQIFSDGTARVSITLTTFNNGFLGGSYARPFGLILKPVSNTWRLIDGEDYWDYCWTSNDCETTLPID